MTGEKKEYKLKLGSIESEVTSVHALRTIEGLHEDNGNIIWKVEFEFFDEVLTSSKNYMLSDSIDEIRKEIEPKGYRILIKWSEIDAHQSGMLGDMSAGTLMYHMKEVEKINKKENHSGGYPSYNILDETDFKKVVTLQVQKDYFEEVRAKRRKITNPKRNWFQRLIKK